MKLLEQIVETDNKKRYAFNDDKTLIRASQGHSICVDLNYKSQIPPDVLYHGTGEKNIQKILNSGIKKMNRQYVHLSIDVETALKVGQRHGKPINFRIKAKEMYEKGFLFYISDNGVWLSEFVPNEFVEELLKLKKK
jgi:putative RNA 2'-phosphotransferase